jgi:DNA-binding PucR family transcriptional regulator
VRDSIALERLGLPSAVIITTEFARETELTRQAIGMKMLEPVVIAHPVSSITADEIAQRVAQIKEQAQQVWLGTKAPMTLRVALQ